VSVPRTDKRIRRLLWFGLLGPPLAWAVQFVLGYGVTEAACEPGRVEPHVNAWTVSLTAVATIVTVLGGLAAVAVFRGTRSEELDGPPPGGRIYFMSIVAMTITPLFLFIIVMNGVGVLVLEKCHQS
jgi:hypothetical protein